MIWKCENCGKEMDSEQCANLCNQCPDCAYSVGDYMNEEPEEVPTSDKRCKKCGIPLDPFHEDTLCEGCED